MLLPSRSSCYSSASSPKSMQQIAILIIAFLAYVQGIRNAGSGSAAGEVGNALLHTYESAAPSYTQQQDYYASQTESNSQNAADFSAAYRQHDKTPFRPSQIIDFTLSDAATPQRYPPSYLAPDDVLSQVLQKAETRQDANKQFAFPSEQQQQQESPFAAYHSSNYQSNTEAVPAQLQTTPVLSYRDPYTNENYHYKPTLATPTTTTRTGATSWPQRNDVHYQHTPQEYTVQSSLLVDAAAAGNNFAGSSPQQQQRPGYVFEEPLNAAYERPLYAQQPVVGYQQPSLNRRRPQAPPPYRTFGATPSQRPGSSHLSYDSHDYPPPSYLQQQPQQQRETQFQPQFQQQQQQYQRPFPSPQRQDTPSTSLPNYANNFGNYLTGAPDYEGQSYYPQRPIQPPHYQPQPAPQARPPARPAYNNYYDYQLGELPPAASYNPNYRPPYRPPTAPSAPSGLATLASLLSSTQQYAPQFTNLLLGSLTGGGGGGGAGSGLSSAASSTRPPSMQLIRALENIARNDDLQCVPKVLCQMIARQTQRGQLPGIVTSPAITNFLAGFPASSPALIYGRAALLAFSGGESSCTQTYAKCPKNEYEIIYYLNNHRGGFFKFFSEPEEQPQTTQQTADDGGGAGSLLSILSALTGNTVSVAPTTTARPKPKPTQQPALASLDIGSGIGNFFTQVLSDYIGGVEHQRRRRRRRSVSDEQQEEEIKGEADIEQETEAVLNDKNFHDDEDEEDTQIGAEAKAKQYAQYADVQGRILHADWETLPQAKFFPEAEAHSEVEQADDGSIENIIRVFNKNNASRKLKFPSETEERQYKHVSEFSEATEEADNTEDSQALVYFRDETDLQPTNGNQINFVEYPHNTRRGKKMLFKEPAADLLALSTLQQTAAALRPAAAVNPAARVIFPDHYETHIRKGRILNRPAYAASYADYLHNSDADENPFVISNAHRPFATSYYSQTASSTQNSYSSSSTYNNYNYAGGQQNSYPSASTSSYKPQHNNNYDYPNSNYVSNNRYSSNYTPTRYTTATPKKYEDNKNIYVTNGQGVTTYYITPEGRKVYL